MENRSQNGNANTHTLCDLSRSLCILPTHFLFSKILKRYIMIHVHSNPAMARPLSSCAIGALRCGLSEGGHFLQKWKKCATFRLLRRYELHFARAVAFSFCEQNGKRAGRMENGGPLVQPVATTDTLRDRSAWSVLWADGGGRLAPPERRGREARHLSQEKGVCRSWRDPYGSVVDFWRCTTSFQLPKKLPHDVGRNLTERLADTVRQNAQ